LSYAQAGPAIDQNAKSSTRARTKTTAGGRGAPENPATENVAGTLAGEPHIVGPVMTRAGLRTRDLRAVKQFLWKLV
jgi:hypothetical protein